jgi:hypothetical protein
MQGELALATVTKAESKKKAPVKRAATGSSKKKTTVKKRASGSKKSGEKK